MIRKLLSAFSLTLLCASLAVAQCSCGNCDGESASCFDDVGTDYTSMDVGGCGTCGDAGCDGDCYGTRGARRCDALTRCRYLSVFGGGNWIDSFKQSTLGPDAIGAPRGGFDDGYLAGFAIGSQVHPNVRYELETTFRNNDAQDWFIEDFTAGVVTSSTQLAAVGDLESVSGMVNFLFDFAERQPGCANFYGGVGFGLVAVEGQIVAGGTTYDVSDSSAAFQAIAGVSYAFRDRVDFYGEYRFLNAQNILVADLTTPVSLGDFEYTNNSLLFGLRFRR